MPTKPTPSERAEAATRDWLLEEGLQVGADIAPGSKWAWVAATPGGWRLGILQPGMAADHVVITSGMMILPAYLQEFVSLPTFDRFALIVELQRVLINLDVGFVGSWETLNPVALMHAIYFDGLTKDRFMSSINRVMNAAILFQGTLTVAFPGLQEGFDSPPPAGAPKAGGRRVGYKSKAEQKKDEVDKS